MRPRFALASLALILAAVLATVAPRESCAQSFGKNKVHYEQLTWAVLETPHLRVHYYAQEESLARALTAFAAAKKSCTAPLTDASPTGKRFCTLCSRSRRADAPADARFGSADAGDGVVGIPPGADLHLDGGPISAEG